MMMKAINGLRVRVTLKYEEVKVEDVIEGNKKEFHNNPRHKYPKKNIPIYKEVTFYGLDGKEKIKVSDFSSELLDISNRLNTYIGLLKKSLILEFSKIWPRI